MWDSILKNIFKENQKCIVSKDEDGMLAGKLLVKYLNWEVVGYCSYNGDASDEVWLFDEDFDLTDAVFVGVPVSDPYIACIDTHFIAPDKDYIDTYIAYGNKINPNVIEGKVRWKEDNSSDIDSAYSLGVARYVAECLVKLGFASDDLLNDLNSDLPDLPDGDTVPFEGLSGKKDAVHKAVLNNVINVYDTFAFSFDSNYTISFTEYI